MQTYPMCIYRDKSVEGFACAWSIWKKLYDNCEYVPVTYADEIPNVRDRDIYILDITYTISDIKKIVNEADSIVLIDNKPVSHDILSLNNKITGIVDINKSSCMLTWNYFHNIKHPMFFEYIQNREFWKFDLPHSKEVFAAITNYDLTFENYDLIETTYIDDLVIEGEALLRKHNSDINNILKYKKFVYINDTKIPIVQAPYFYSSECANILAEEYDIGASYHCTFKNIVFSLRSSKTSDIDVSELAKLYGGGGTKHAAGFVIHSEYDPIQQILDGRKNNCSLTDVELSISEHEFTKL